MCRARGETGGGARSSGSIATVRVAGRAVSELVERARDPRLSPDGQRLVLTTGPVGDGDLWSYDLRRPAADSGSPSANDNRVGRLEPRWHADRVLVVSAAPYRHS